MAGFDPESKECEMYVLDYLASMVKAPFAAHGYGGFFTTALMDRKYRKGKSWRISLVESEALCAYCLFATFQKKKNIPQNFTLSKPFFVNFPWNGTLRHECTIVFAKRDSFER